MEKRSRHYGDVQRWIEKVIDSCETYDQIHPARRLIWNFEKQMAKNKVGRNIAYTIGAHLRDLISNKIVEIQKKYLEP